MRGARHWIGVNKAFDGTFDQSVGTCAITPLPIKTASVGLLAGVSVTEACG